MEYFWSMDSGGKQRKLMYQEFLSKLGYEKFKFMCYAKQCIFKVNF